MSYAQFKKLHQQDEVLILGNIWDAQSAKLAEEAGYQALGSSSHAIANLLGYEDGEKISVDEILFMIDRIVKSTKLPVSVDFESGYADDPETVAKHVKQLMEAGAIGINIEDGKVGIDGRKLAPAKVLVDKIEAIKSLSGDIFINARIDTFTTKHENAVNESIERIKLYEKAGADGIFIPLAQKDTDIEELVKSTDLPLNLFLTPDLPNLETLQKLGVKRLSHGAKIYEWLIKQNKEVFDSFIKNPKLP